jgi:hypothetical protein
MVDSLKDIIRSRWLRCRHAIGIVDETAAKFLDAGNVAFDWKVFENREQIHRHRKVLSWSGLKCRFLGIGEGVNEEWN